MEGSEPAADKPRGHRVRFDEIVASVVADPDDPRSPVLLSGFIGKGQNDRRVRIYFDLSFNAWVDVAVDDIVHSVPIPDSKLGGSHVWLKQGARMFSSRAANVASPADEPGGPVPIYTYGPHTCPKGACPPPTHYGMTCHPDQCPPPPTSVGETCPAYQCPPQTGTCPPDCTRYACQHSLPPHFCRPLQELYAPDFGRGQGTPGLSAACWEPTPSAVTVGPCCHTRDWICLHATMTPFVTGLRTGIYNPFR